MLKYSFFSIQQCDTGGCHHFSNTHVFEKCSKAEITLFAVRTGKVQDGHFRQPAGAGTLVKIKKVGYQQALLPIKTSVTDTTPVTATLLQMGQSLAPVIVVGDRAIWLSKGDTVRELLRNGFYERRETSAAPRSAFISGDKMRGAALVSDARFFGRGICESNVYIDGVRVAVPTRSGHFKNEGLDALVSPFDIAGIETYTTGEMPIGAGHTVEGAGTFSPAAASAAAMANASGTLASTGCVTFIWLTR